MRATCSKFLQRDCHATLQGCIVRQVLLQHLCPDGVTTGLAIVVPRRRERPPKNRRREGKPIISAPAAKKLRGRPLKTTPHAPDRTITQIVVANKQVGRSLKRKPEQRQYSIIQRIKCSSNFSVRLCSSIFFLEFQRSYSYTNHLYF